MKSPRVDGWSEMRERTESQETGRGREVYKGARELSGGYWGRRCPGQRS